MNALDHLERLLSITERFKPELTGKDLDWWQDAAAFAADERESCRHEHDGDDGEYRCAWCNTTDTMNGGDTLCEACDELAESDKSPRCAQCSVPLKAIGQGESLVWIDHTGGDVCVWDGGGDDSRHLPLDDSEGGVNGPW